MGMLEGAIIGGVVGSIVGGYMTWQTTQWQKKFLAALDAGDRAGASRALARHAKPTPRAKAFSLTRLLPQRNRVIGLWLLGDLDGVRAELALHAGSGGAAYLMNVHLFGLVALAIESPGDAAALVREIQDTAARIDKESNRLQKLLRDYATMLARVAVGLAGQPIEEADASKLIQKATGEPILTRVLLLRALVVAAERTDKPALKLHGLLARLTRRFAPSAAG